MKGEKAYTSACDCPGTCSYCRTDNTSGNAWHGAILYLLSEQISKTDGWCASRLRQRCKGTMWYGVTESVDSFK